MTDVPMFAAPPAAPLRLSKALAVYKVKGKPGTYAKYAAVKRDACWECVNCLHEAGGTGDPPRPATTCRTGGYVELVDAKTNRPYFNDKIYLCGGHTEIWKRLDGVDAKPTRGRGRR